MKGLRKLIEVEKLKDSLSSRMVRKLKKINLVDVSGKRKMIEEITVRKVQKVE